MRRTEAKELADRLTSAPAFSGCRARDIETLVSKARRSSVPAGWPLIQQDTPGDACYVILDGVAEVNIGGEKVAELASGAVVGEVALATGKLRNATVTSITPLDLLHIDAADFEAATGRRPALRDAMAAGSGSGTPTA
jgi:CRP/FNR family cyclic AMP-dependent transcriptional regulator